MKNNQTTDDDFGKISHKSSQERSFAGMVQDTVNKILDRFLSRHPREKELRDFMDDEKKLYNEDGSLTEAYKKQIKDMEAYVLSNPIDEDITDLLAQNDIEVSMYLSIIRFINQRSEIIKEFQNTESIEEEDFSPEKFVKSVLLNESYSEEERKQILDTIERLAEEDSLEALDDDAVKRAFKEIINNKDNKPD